MPAPATWVAIVICIFGVGWVLAGSWSTPSLVGDVMALVCCISLAAKFVNDRAVSHRDMTPSLILAGLAVALVSWVMGDPMALSGSQWGYMITLCLFVISHRFFLDYPWAHAHSRSRSGHVNAVRNRRGAIVGLAGTK